MQRPQAAQVRSSTERLRLQPVQGLTFPQKLALLLGAGAVIRLCLAVLLIHGSYDMDSVRIVDSTLRSHPGSIYLTGRWPYPGGLLPWVFAAGSLARASGVDISVWFKLPEIAADLGIAWLVQAFLGLRGESQRRRLASAALVSLGPSFIAISGYEGQIDALAVLPGVAAMYVWERSADIRLGGPPSERARSAVALLIGVGAAIKTVPILLVLAFLPRLRGWWARGRFSGLAVAVPLLSVLPWLALNPNSLSIILKYSGIGVGPLALIVQPSITKDILVKGANVPFHGPSMMLENHGKLILFSVLALAALLVVARRPRPEVAAAVLWLAVYAAIPYFFFQYVLWGLPFLLMAGFLGGVATAQAILFVPTILWEARPWQSQSVIWPYYVSMTLAWAIAVMSLVVRALHLYRQPST